MYENNNKMITAPNPHPITYPYYENDADPREIQDYLRYYTQVIITRRWLILLIMLLSTTLAFITAFKEVHVYRAGATIQINLEKAKILPYQEVRDMSPYVASEKYLQTQCSVLQSRSLADRVIRKLSLDKNPDFLALRPPAALESWKEKFFSFFPTNGKKDEEARPAVETDETYSPYTEKLLGSLEIVPSIQRSQIIQINYISESPRLAATVANTVAKEYIQLNLENQYEATQQAMTFLSKQITEMKGKVENADEALLKYARVYNLPPPSDKEKSSPEQELANLKTTLSETKTERIRKESQYQVLKSAGPNEPMPTLVKTARMSSLEEKIAELRQREAGLNRRFHTAWPELGQVRAQLQELQRQLKEEEQRVARVIQRDYAEVVERERMLSQAVAQQQALAMKTQEHAIQYNILKREVEINKQLLESMLQRLKEAAVSSSLNASNITILDLADAPKVPFKPNKKLRVLYGLLIGLCLGIGMALIIARLDDTIKTPEEINYYVRLPVLGVIPARIESGTSRRKLPIKKSNGGQTHAPMYTLAFDDARSPVSEAFRVVRTAMLLSNNANPPRTILITSPQLEDGKTTLSHNVAIMLAQINRSVVLLDCDLRRPRVHKTFGLTNARGMSTYLSGDSDLDAILCPTRIPKLQVIPSGPIPPNPAELLSSERMAQALEQLSKKFDYVIIDSSPLLFVTDAYILSSIVDGVVLVARADKVPKDTLQRVKQSLMEVNANVLGVVLNKMDSRMGRYGYRRYYYYSYGSHDESPFAS